MGHVISFWKAYDVLNKHERADFYFGPWHTFTGYAIGASDNFFENWPNFQNIDPP